VQGQRDVEAAVKACYSTWSERYYNEYYGDAAGYPPVHRELLRGFLRGTGAQTVLDAGCGPASFLRDMTEEGWDLYGFDLTPEMVVEARRILGEKGIPANHIWEGSVLDTAAFQPPDADLPRRFDAAVCIGVLPHIPAGTDGAVIENLRSAVAPGGWVAVEARNELFALFTLNRYSHAFFLDRLIQPERLRAVAGEELAGLEAGLESLQERFRMDLPPVRKGYAGEPGYDEVLSRTHNPFELRAQFEAAGLQEVKTLFYHYHCLPPMLQGQAPRLFRQASLALEGDPEDWRGYFMASAFLVVGRAA